MWTFDVLSAEVPDVRLHRTDIPTGIITLAARDDWIIGWVSGNTIHPLYKEPRKIICKHMYTGESEEFMENDQFMKKLGVYGLLPEGTRHVSRFQFRSRF